MYQQWPGTLVNAITGGARKLPEPKSGVSQQSVVSTRAIHQVSNTTAETKTFVRNIGFQATADPRAQVMQVDAMISA